MPCAACKTVEKLIKAGFRAGERVAILSQNRPEYAVLVSAFWKIGAVAVPLSIRYPADMANDCLRGSGCLKMFVSPDTDSPELQLPKYLIEDFVRLPEKTSEYSPPGPAGLNLDADASIIFTSSSSGRPRAVLHSLANHYYSALGLQVNIPFGRSDRWLMSLPMYHVSGFSLLMRAVLNQGTIVFHRPGLGLKESIEQGDFTHVSLVPAQLSELLADADCVRALRKLKAILLGGSAAPTAIVREALAQKLPLHITYGSTEMASGITATKQGDLAANSRSCGGVLDYRRLRIAPDGRILVKGRTLFRGYLDKAIPHRELDEQGWFNTGDTGFIENGCLFVTGRKDLMFVSGGENIFPEEIERAIEDIEDVERALVVPVEDRVFGHRPAAFVKVRSGRPLNEVSVRKSLQRSLEGFKVPVAFFAWPQCDGSSIKPDRRTFRRHADRLMCEQGRFEL